MACDRTSNVGQLGSCKCTFTDCGNWGKCCACVLNHRAKGEMPGCFFTPEAEKAGNRSVSYFIQTIGVPVTEKH